MNRRALSAPANTDDEEECGMGKSIQSRIFSLFVNAYLFIAAFICIAPFVLLVVASFTDNNTIAQNGYSFWPEKWSLDAYAYLWQRSETILSAYGITVLITALGTTFNVILTTLIAYPLSRADLVGRKPLSFIVFFTMLFNGGLVPTYLLYTNYLGVKNTIWGLIMPNLMLSAYYVIIMRTFFVTSIPSALIEAAQIDGASELKIFGKIIVPMGRPIIATVALFVGIAYWNDWFNGMVYITDEKLYSIQNLLTRLLNDIAYIQSATNSSDQAAVLSQMPAITVRMAIAFIGILPIVVIYPFVQKNFVKNIAIGSVKG